MKGMTSRNRYSSSGINPMVIPTKNSLLKTQYPLKMEKLSHTEPMIKRERITVKASLGERKSWSLSLHFATAQIRKTEIKMIRYSKVHHFSIY
jgi:hypothetical protein